MKRKLVWILILTLAASVTLLAVGAIETSFSYGPSMEPTLRDDTNHVELNVKTNKVGEIVGYSFEQHGFTKRICASAGDHVTFSEDSFFRNGDVVKYDFETTSFNYGESANLDIIVDDGEVFLMGDNRGESFDSRRLGAVDADNISGIVIGQIKPGWVVTAWHIVQPILMGLVIFGYIMVLNLISGSEKSA